MRSLSRSTASASGMLNFTACLADVEIDLARRAADVAEIGVGHFAGAVHDAAHDGDLHALEMRGRGFDFRGRGLEIEERAAAARAGHVVGLENARRRRPAGCCRRGAAPGPGASSPCTRTASPMPSQSSAPMFVRGGEQRLEKVRLRVRRRRERVLEQDGMPRVEPRGEQAEGGDDGQIEAVARR